MKKYVTAVLEYEWTLQTRTHPNGRVFITSPDGQKYLPFQNIMEAVDYYNSVGWFVSAVQDYGTIKAVIFMSKEKEEDLAKRALKEAKDAIEEAMGVVQGEWNSYNPKWDETMRLILEALK